MSDKPIIFSAPMVRALLDGRKTQTRRVLKPQPFPVGGPFYRPFPKTDPRQWYSVAASGVVANIQTAPYAPGDRLWVREAWGLGLSDHGDCPRYRATMDYQCGDKIKSEHEGPFKWKSPIHMPRKFSRMTLTVTEVRVQRLREISEADAEAEGARPAFSYPSWEGVSSVPRYIWGFHELWNSIHCPDAWDANPWVCALTFTVHRGNIDSSP